MTLWPLIDHALFLYRMLALMFLISAVAQAQDRDTMQMSRGKARAMLANVEHWGCQYQNIDPPSIASSALELVVIDPVLDGGTGRLAGREDVEIMRRRPDGGRRLVIAYLAIGAAESYRPYWNPTWNTEPPVWLGPHNPAWPRSYAVRYWNPEWRRIVMEGLQSIVAAGFDGVFLDRVDAYQDWPGEGESARADMAEFVAQLAQVARASQPGFLFIGQNAENLLTTPRYRDAIDAVSKESLLTGLQGPGLNNRADQVAWSMNYLVPAQRAGLTILAIEYLETPADIEIARRRHRAMGFAPFFATRLLDRLP